MRAAHRRKESDYGIGAAIEADVTEPGRDGRLLRVLLTDTVTGAGYAEVVLPRVTDPLDEEGRERVETAVEALAGAFPSEARLAAMVERGTFSIDLWTPRA